MEFTITESVSVRESIGQCLRAARARRGLSQRALAEAIRTSGDGEVLGLNQSEISRIESGDRGLSVEQWLLLAAVLNCPPILLLVPLGLTEVPLQVSAQSQLHPELAMKWIIGQSPLATSDDLRVAPQDASTWNQMRLPLLLHEELAAAEAASGHDLPQRPLSDRAAAAAYADLARALLNMITEGLTVPDLPPWTLGRLAQFGHDPDELGLGSYNPEWWVERHSEAEPIPMRHYVLRGVFDIPDVLASDFEAAGWRKARR